MGPDETVVALVDVDQRGRGGAERQKGAFGSGEHCICFDLIWSDMIWCVRHVPNFPSFLLLLQWRLIGLPLLCGYWFDSNSRISDTSVVAAAALVRSWLTSSSIECMISDDQGSGVCGFCHCIDGLVLFRLSVCLLANFRWCLEGVGYVSDSNMADSSIQL